MTIADSRVVAWEYRTLNAVDGWSMWSKCTEADFQSLCKSHYSATVEVRELVPLSLLAEAESAANNLHTNLIAAYAERDALQSRLDAVGRLADQWEGVVRQMGGHDTPHTNAAINTCVKELRAALGGESPGNEEERK